MSDNDILAKWRARYPGITLAVAKALEKGERRWAHLMKR